MDKQAVIGVIALLLMSNESVGKLTQIPRDTASKVNESTYFNCSTDLVDMAKHIFWHHGAKHVYTGGEVYDGYKGRVEIDINDATGACNLIIHSVQPGDAGIYKCWEDEGHKEQSSAQLVVLDDDPICQSNVELHDVIGQNTCHLKRDEVQLSCSVTFHGVPPPRMEWKKTEDDINITGTISSVISGNTYNSTLILENDINIHNSAYVCQINGTTENQYKCVSEVIKLSYSVDSGEVVYVERGAKLTCVANTTFNCNYRWFQGNDSICPVSCNQNVIAHALGEYHCEAKCSVRGKSCTFVAMEVFVKPEPEHAVDRIYGFPALVIIAIASCLIGATGVAIFLYLNPRKKPRNIAEAVTFFKFASEALVHADEKEKQEYIKKSGQDPFVSEAMLAALRQVYSMFPKKDISHAPNTGLDVRRSVCSTTRVETNKPEGDTIERCPISESEYSGLKTREKCDGHVYTSIDSGKDFSS